MTKEKREILDKVNELLDKKTEELLREFPYIHEIDDGIIIRFFTNWDDCINNIKFKRILNNDNPDDITIFYFLPKGAIIELKERDYIHCVACLSGKLELKIGEVTELLTGFNKVCFDTDKFEGVALEDTYVITSNRK